MLFNSIVAGVVLSFIAIISGLDITVEHANVTFMNPKYLEFAKIYIKRYGRRSPYYINAEAKTLHTWTNNVTFHFIFFEYLHNEYRRSFVELHLKFCDMINKDPYLGGMLKKHGLACPAQSGDYHLLNMTIAAENFPNVFPIEKCKVEVEFVVTETSESILKCYGHAIIKPGKKKKP